jgi:hypothetical protein
MALPGASCLTLKAVVGITHWSLRAQLSQLLGEPHTRNRMSYDLGRLRLNGLIQRLDASNTDVITPEGQRVAIFYSKPEQRLLRPLLAADQSLHRRHGNKRSPPPTPTSRPTSTEPGCETPPENSRSSTTRGPGFARLTSEAPAPVLFQGSGLPAVPGRAERAPGRSRGAGGTTDGRPAPWAVLARPPARSAALNRNRYSTYTC